MRLIDADALDYALGASDEDIYFHHMLDDAPTIPAIPVEWLRNIILTCDDEESKAAYKLLHKWNDEHFTEYPQTD